jgi:hypothetical protein
MNMLSDAVMGLARFVRRAYATMEKRNTSRPQMDAAIRVLGCIIVAVTTVVSMRVFQHYASISLDRTFIAAVAMAASFLTWLVTGID